MTNRYCFDEVINRVGTSSLKYDFANERKGRDDLLPLWVADMDFRLPDEILEKITQRVQHGIFGYTDPKQDYYAAVQSWFQHQHHWNIQPEWITVTPGVVYAISTAICALTQKGDAILIQQPVYYPFSDCILDNGRVLINSQLQYQDGHYSIDFDDFESKIKQYHVKMFILCNPHNPVGRVWRKDELLRIGQICIKHHVFIFSDEIHCDILYPGYHHIPFASINDEFKDHVIVGTSPSKTFNMAGLQVSNIIIPNSQLREQFRKQNAAQGYSQANTLGLIGCQAAYELGVDWYHEMLDYLEANLTFVRSFLQANLPQVKLIEPEGTYLLWLDFSGLKMTEQQLNDFIVNEAHLWLDEGVIFGQETALFERINIACPQVTLQQALIQLKDAIHRLL